MTLFNRDIAVTIGDRRIAARSEGDEDKSRPTLRVAFRVDKSADRNPNTANLAIWNLSADTRAALQGEERVPVVIEAGYVGQMQQIYSGELEVATSRRDGPDWITEFESGDGSQAFRSKRINETLGPGTLLKDVLEKLARELGVGLGNSIEKIREGDYRGAVTELASGVTLSGKVADAMDKYATAAGFEWHIDNGTLVVLRPGDVLPEDTIQLTYGSGLVGSPDRGERGIVSARSLLIGALTPGRKVEIVSGEVDGFYVVAKASHSGDIFGSEWYTDIEARPL